MPELELLGCTATPFGNYLKALGVLRLVSEQADDTARGSWRVDVFVLRSTLNADSLSRFFLRQYRPTPIVAPWNGGSGFYPKDNKEGIDAIAGSSDDRFAEYRGAIAYCRSLTEVQEGKSGDEEERRAAILRRCRNWLSESAVEWLDASIGIAADGSRAFAPVLGTGGNEGRLDYTNNFMARVASLLIQPDKPEDADSLLRSALFASRTEALEKGAAGQYDPGRAGGANQGQGIEAESVVNPWDLVLTLEGAVMWASGLHRRQGAGNRTALCSPFTVRPSKVGYGSASAGEDSRAEIWAPLWAGAVSYGELRSILREGRASVNGRAATNGVEFAEAACSLGVDRGIERFVRYSLLKRRGDSYVALPAGTFPVRYRSDSDRVRQLLSFVDQLDCSPEDQRRIESAAFELLLRGTRERMRTMVRALGRAVKTILFRSAGQIRVSSLRPMEWMESCGLEEAPEVIVAGALASLRDLWKYVSRREQTFAWIGRDLPERMISVLDRILLSEEPIIARYRIAPGYATLLVEGSLDEDAIEELMFGFFVLNWKDFSWKPHTPPKIEILPEFDVVRRVLNRRTVALLKKAEAKEAIDYAMGRLRVKAELGKLVDVTYAGGIDAMRLAAALLVPVWMPEKEEREEKVDAVA